MKPSPELPILSRVNQAAQPVSINVPAGSRAVAGAGLEAEARELVAADGQTRLSTGLAVNLP